MLHQRHQKQRSTTPSSSSSSKSAQVPAWGKNIDAMGVARGPCSTCRECECFRADQTLQAQSASHGPPQRCQRCGHTAGDHDVLSDNPYVNVIGSASPVRPGSHSSSDQRTCMLPGCNQPRFVEASGKMHDCCSRSHGRQLTTTRAPVSGSGRSSGSDTGGGACSWLATGAHAVAHGWNAITNGGSSGGGGSPSYDRGATGGALSSGPAGYGNGRDYSSNKGGYNNYGYPNKKQSRNSGDLCFYNRGDPYYEFTNFYPAPITIDGIRWPTSEHYFQAMKFEGVRVKALLRAMVTEADVRDFARRFAQLRRPEWANHQLRDSCSELYRQARLQQRGSRGEMVVVDNDAWASEVHFLAACSYGPDLTVPEVVSTLDSPRDAFEFSRQHSTAVRRDWEQVKIDRVMLVALRAKFTQHEDLRQLLLGTGDRRLVEHTRNDRFWGDGGDGSGQNMLGQLLMKVRAELRQNHIPALYLPPSPSSLPLPSSMPPLTPVVSPSPSPSPSSSPSSSLSLSPALPPSLPSSLSPSPSYKSSTSSPSPKGQGRTAGERARRGSSANKQAHRRVGRF